MITYILLVLIIIEILLFTWMERKKMAALDDLTAQVASNTTVINSALTLIQGIEAQLAAAGTDPAKLAALTASLQASDTALAAAVAANTPAATTTTATSTTGS